MPKKKPKQTIKARVYIYLKKGTKPVAITSPSRIFLESDTKGIRLRDGLPVHKSGDKWVYRSR